jgi:hypothetical protein
MYKIIKAQGKDGTDKLKDIEAKHSLYGELYINTYAFFEYNDDSGQMMHTTSIENVVMLDNRIMITTENSEYWFEKMEG